MTNASTSSSEALDAAREIEGFLTSVDLLWFFQYWRDKRDGRDMPSRRDIDPIDIGRRLSKLFLIDFEPPEKFIYRLTGTDIAEVFGRSNLKGVPLDEAVSSERAAAITNRWLPLVTRRAVLCMKGHVYQSVDRIPDGERIMMPLSDEDGGPVTGLVGMTVCDWREGPVDASRIRLDERAYPVSEIN